jgi:hypothetical protein
VNDTAFWDLTCSPVENNFFVLLACLFVFYVFVFAVVVSAYS